MNTPENGSVTTPYLVSVPGTGSNPNSDSPGSSSGGSPVSAPGTGPSKPKIHILVTERVKIRIDALRVVLETENDRRVTNNEVIDYLLNRWERT